MTERTNTNKPRGRPPLSPGGASDSTKVSYFFPNDLLTRIKAKGRKLGLTDSNVVRGVLEEFLDRFQAASDLGAVLLELDDDPVSQFLRRAAEVHGLDPYSVVRTVLRKHLPEYIREGTEQNKRLSDSSSQ